MSFVGSGLIVNTAGLYFDALGQDLGISRTAAAFPVSVRLIVSALAMLLFGRVFSRLNLRVALSVCVIVCTTAFLACAWFDSAWQFDAAFAVMGASYVVPVTLAPPVLLSMWFPTRFGTVMGIAGCLSGLGGAVFNPLVSHMITAYGWRTAYAATGVTVLLLLLPFAATVMERPSPRNAPDVQKSQTNIPDASLSDSQKKYRRHLAFGLLLLSMVLLQIASGINQHVPAHELAVGLTLGQASMVVSARMIGSAVGKSTLRLLLDGRRPSLVMGLYSVIGWIGWIGIWLAMSARLPRARVLAIMSSPRNASAICAVLTTMGTGRVEYGHPSFSASMRQMSCESVRGLLGDREPSIWVTWACAGSRALAGRVRSMPWVCRWR